MSEQHSGGVLYCEFFEGFRTLLSADGEVFDIVELSEERDGGVEVLLELLGWFVPFCVEDEDEEMGEIVEEGAGEDFVRLEFDYVAHMILIVWEINIKIMQITHFI